MPKPTSPQRSFKFLLPGCIRGESIAQLPLSGSVQQDQFSGHILGGFPGLGLGFLPGIGTDFVQLHRFVFAAAADVLADHVQLGGGYKEGVAALIGDFDIVLDGIVHLDLLHGHKPADTVVFVNHQIAGGQIGKGVELLAVGGAGLFGSHPLGLGSCDQLAFRENCQTR